MAAVSFFRLLKYIHINYAISLIQYSIHLGLFRMHILIYCCCDKEILIKASNPSLTVFINSTTWSVSGKTYCIANATEFDSCCAAIRAFYISVFLSER